MNQSSGRVAWCSPCELPPTGCRAELPALCAPHPLPCHCFLTAPAASFSSLGSRCHDPLGWPLAGIHAPLAAPCCAGPEALPPPSTALAGSKHICTRRSSHPAACHIGIYFSSFKRRCCSVTCWSLVEVVPNLRLGLPWAWPPTLAGASLHPCTGKRWDGFQTGPVQLCCAVSGCAVPHWHLARTF